MKTSLMILAAFSLGTAAVAQDSTMQPGASAPAPATAPTTPDPSMPTNTLSTPQTDAAAPAPADPAAATPAPADPAAGTSGGMSAPAPAPMSAATAPQPATTDYPACSRTVTDKCVQKGGTAKGGTKKSRRH